MINRLSFPTAPGTVEMNAEYVPTGFGRGGPSGPDAVQGVALHARYETPEQAEAAAALFPKSCRVRVGTLGTYTGLGTPDYRTFTLHTIHVSITLSADKVNGGRNETGIKRYRSIMKAINKAGLAVEWVAGCGNSYASQADFENAL